MSERWRRARWEWRARLSVRLLCVRWEFELDSLRWWWLKHVSTLQGEPRTM